MNQRDLLIQLDEFTADEANAGRTGQWAAKLIREAAAEIRSLQKRLDAAERTNKLLMLSGVDVEAEAGL